MSYNANMQRSQAFSAVTVIGAAGILALPIPAQAIPAVPLAPACAKYEFTAPFEYTQDNGYFFQFPANGDRIQGRAMYAKLGQTEATFGTANGSINGRTIKINVTWDQGPGRGLWSDITGQINDDLFASGTAKNSQGVTNTWKTSAKQRCVPAEKPQPPPPPPQAPKTATVLKATNIHDLPDGEGTPFLDENGEPIFKPPGQVTLIEPGLCRDQWCHVVAPEVPPGEGWIYIGEGHGTFP